MSLRRHWPFIALIAVLLAVPLSLVGWNELRLHNDRHVLLRIHPVDPHDLFRGEYVQLSYDISVLDPHARAGHTVYVPLHRSGEHWTGNRVTHRKPEGGVFMRGCAGGRFGVQRSGLESRRTSWRKAPRAGTSERSPTGGCSQKWRSARTAAPGSIAS